MIGSPVKLKAGNKVQVDEPNYGRRYGVAWHRDFSPYLFHSPIFSPSIWCTTAPPHFVCATTNAAAAATATADPPTSGRPRAPWEKGSSQDGSAKWTGSGSRTTPRRHSGSSCTQRVRTAAS